MDPDPGEQKSPTKIEEKLINFISEVLNVLFEGVRLLLELGRP